jgi:septum formation protein
MTIILASTSEIRSQILASAGISHTVVRPSVDEERLKVGAAEKAPAELARYLAETKALSVSPTRPGNLVIGADQVLVFEHTVYNKPADVREARQHLQQLRGKSHQLISAVACCSEGRVLWTHAETAILRMRNFTDRFLDTYVEASGPDICASVGAYKLEGLGVQLFEDIDGDHFTILGLPLLPLLGFLRRRNEITS